jgi:hypothetical protein
LDSCRTRCGVYRKDYLINPSNPLVSIVKVKESRWNRYRVWKALSLMVLSGLFKRWTLA